MLKCLMKYEWVKLRRDTLPTGKGIMGAWAKLAARAAFRKGHASYCGYKNAVSPGMWSGGLYCWAEEYSRHQKPRTGFGNTG